VQLTVGAGKKDSELLDMLLAKKRSGDRKSWLEKNGDQAELV
jgi:topoisomerase-4 subunit B